VSVSVTVESVWKCLQKKNVTNESPYKCSHSLFTLYNSVHLPVTSAMSDSERSGLTLIHTAELDIEFIIKEKHHIHISLRLWTLVLYTYPYRWTIAAKRDRITRLSAATLTASYMVTQASVWMLLVRGPGPSMFARCSVSMQTDIKHRTAKIVSILKGTFCLSLCPSHFVHSHLPSHLLESLMAKKDISFRILFM
jgi:hypothetical protein